MELTCYFGNTQYIIKVELVCINIIMNSIISYLKTSVTELTCYFRQNVIKVALELSRFLL